MARLEAVVSGCTALIVYRGPARVCGRPFRGYDTAGEPRCGFHSRASRRGLADGVRSAKASESGEFQIEPELVECQLSCKTCGERTTILLPGDMPAREALAEISCPKCLRRGALVFCRNERTGSP